MRLTYLHMNWAYLYFNLFEKLSHVCSNIATEIHLNYEVTSQSLKGLSQKASLNIHQIAYLWQAEHEF